MQAGTHRRTASCGCCFIIPPDVLKQLANDPKNADQQTVLRDTLVDTLSAKKIREAHRNATQFLLSSSSLAARKPDGAAAGPAEQHLFDCRHRSSLPGRSVANPAHAADPAAQQVYAVTAAVDQFYRTVLKRDSVDNRHMDLVSSVHYGRSYDNAFWNGQQMVYGDGDQQIFTAFYGSPDVIGHELTHGITQNESGLVYEGESGALNESISDVFGAVFNQWHNKWPVTNAAGWLIGAGIMGPRAKAAGKSCLRDMQAPGATHCLSPQPSSYAQFNPAGDVHDNSGIPNRAFALFATSVGGNAWDAPIQTWYKACIDHRLSSRATFGEFAALTIVAAQSLGGAELARKASEAWIRVEVPIATS